MSVPKLDDAVYAGTKRSSECTLIVTEGDSAKTFALWGIHGINGGKLVYGVFPLRGKILNVKDATATQLNGNVELLNLKKILGLKHSKKYDTQPKRNTLRYNCVLVLTDADQDGTHIRGLVINWIHTYWPELLKAHFVCTMRTPIVTAHNREFFTEQDFEIFKKSESGQRASSATYKYYKGLGTSTKEDSKRIFSRVSELTIGYTYNTQSDDESVRLAFAKDTNSTTDRKKWLSEYDKNAFISQDELIRSGGTVSIFDFVHKELVHFSIYDCLRSIPNVYDGFKPSQRKIVYYMLKKKIHADIKVLQLSGYISAETGYYHGEVLLQQAIVLLAQDFIGTNNLPLLVPGSNFGSRFTSKDAASARYIFTRLQSYTSQIFDTRDNKLLTYCTDDQGAQIEPVYFVPALPMVLINGADGIGTGFSTSIPKYNPLQLIDYISQKILGTPTTLEIKPWYRGFKVPLSSATTTSGSWSACTLETQRTRTKLSLQRSHRLRGYSYTRTF